MNANSSQIDLPGPQDYAKNQALSNFERKKQSGANRPFNVNHNRFTNDDNGVPGAGTYSLPDTCKVKDPKLEMASFKSNQEKSWDIVIGRNNPGIGEYDTQHLKTIANKEF